MSEEKCKLCHRYVKLCKSHIIPEFIYDGLFDKEKHRCSMISTGEGKRPEFRQTGIWEYLLCQKCENHISRFEQYAREILFGEMELAFIERPGITIFKEIDYTTFKLFLISMLWRCGVSQRREFVEFKLGIHCETLRNMILDKNPGEPHEYGCFFITTSKFRDIIDDMVLIDGEGRFDSHRFYKILMRGICFMFLVSSHTNQIPYPEFFLSKSGELPIVWDEKVFPSYVFNVAKDLHRNLQT